MESSAEQAQQLGIERGYWDISGSWQEAAPEVLESLVRIRTRFEESAGPQPSVIVLAQGASQRCVLDEKSAEVVLRFEGGAERALGRTSPEGAIDIPALDEIGYHSLRIADQRTVPVIVYPPRCYQGPSEKRVFGISSQIYSLAPQGSKAVGSFEDLRTLCSLALSQGASFVGLNPLHYLGEGEASPYSPSSRIAYNTLFVDIAWAQRELALEVDCDLPTADSVLIEYPRAYEQQSRCLHALWQGFRSTQAGSSRAQGFEEFCAACSPELRLFAIYEALQARFKAQSSDCYGWQQWPEEYRRPDATAVQAFAEEQREQIRFHLFGQWLAHLQLAAVVSEFNGHADALGLYTDLALGVRANSADAWIFQDGFSFEVSVGAPPDAFNPGGQDWGLPALDPQGLEQLAFRPFILSVREAMRFAGAIRIDHVMSLFRLYWVSQGSGAYVRYPVEALFGIVALESQRESCVVIGEDLGTVPDEVRAAMDRFGVYSYKVLIFMRDGQGSFVSRGQYPSEALVTPSTHDLPTIAGFFAEQDVAVREQLALHEPQVIEDLRQERQEARAALESLLRTEAAAGQGEPKTSEAARIDQIAASCRFVAGTPSRLCALQLEDLAAEIEQVNLPGTTTEHPNWRRRIPKSLEALFEAPWVLQLLADVRQLRD